MHRQGFSHSFPPIPPLFWKNHTRELQTKSISVKSTKFISLWVVVFWQHTITNRLPNFVHGKYCAGLWSGRSMKMKILLVMCQLYQQIVSLQWRTNAMFVTKREKNPNDYDLKTLTYLRNWRSMNLGRKIPASTIEPKIQSWWKCHGNNRPHFRLVNFPRSDQPLLACVQFSSFQNRRTTHRWETSNLSK